MSSAKVTIQEENLFSVVPQREIHRIVTPAAQGLPGPKGEKGDDGSIENLDEIGFEFFRAKKSPIKDLTYTDGMLTKIDYLNSQGDPLYYQEFVFEDELLVEIILNRVEDQKTFRKILYYSADDYITKIKTIGE